MKNYDKLQFDCNRFADSDEFGLYLQNEYPNFLGKGVQVAVQKGWWPFILHLAQFLRGKGLEKDVQIAQIKEKFGYLRIYAYPISEQSPSPLRIAIVWFINKLLSLWFMKKLRNCWFMKKLLDIVNKDIYRMVYDEIAELERFSGSYCEKCGSRENVSTDELPNRYWVKTYCDACRQGLDK